jgi:hypothetical protein
MVNLIDSLLCAKREMDQFEGYTPANLSRILGDAINRIEQLQQTVLDLQGLIEQTSQKENRQ